MMGSLVQDLPAKIIQELSEKSVVNSLDYSNVIGEDHQKIIGAIKSLESLGDVISVQISNVKRWVCQDEGREIASSGSHEARLLAALLKAAPEGRTVDEIKQEFDKTANVALGAAIKNKWVKKEGSRILAVVEAVEDTVQQHMQLVADGNAANLQPKQLQDYKKRKLIRDQDTTVFKVTKGPDFKTDVSKQESLLTREMVKSGAWEKLSFKPFNFSAVGNSEQRPGYLHPLMQLKTEFRRKFQNMGFQEMDTNSYVESAFWNFDALFQPQQHPARDAHDTFYVSDPQTTLEVPRDYMQCVSKVHSVGGYGSSGYRYQWSEEEAHKNLLRTHTTAVSARMLRKLAQDGFRPCKLFSIDRVFRNETLDATHLAEFHQVEGVVADYNLGLPPLIGIIKEFFKCLGFEKLRFKTTYNPYTEPSLEVYSYHEGLKKWVELGNSGMFRPEMLRPMGLPDNVSVIGFGLSLERPAMIISRSNNIRELVGPRVKLENVFNNPICVLPK